MRSVFEDETREDFLERVNEYRPDTRFDRLTEEKIRDERYANEPSSYNAVMARSRRAATR